MPRVRWGVSIIHCLLGYLLISHGVLLRILVVMKSAQPLSYPFCCQSHQLIIGLDSVEFC
jgi:hypothetical protein